MGRGASRFRHDRSVVVVSRPSGQDPRLVSWGRGVSRGVVISAGRAGVALVNVVGVIGQTRCEGRADDGTGCR